MRLRVRPTAYGGFFFLSLVGMLLGSANYGNNLGFLITFLLLSMAAVSLLTARAQLRSIEIRGCSAHPVFAGQEASFTYMLCMSGPTAGRSIDCSLPGSAPVTVDIPAKGDTQASLLLPAPRRGVLHPPDLHLATQYPLGIFKVHVKKSVTASCLVYPAPYPLDLPLPRGTGGQGAGSSGGPDVEDFAGLREYTPGDVPQRIDWKASMRGHGLLTKEFEGRKGGAIQLDFESLPATGKEERLSMLCRQALQAHGLGEHFSLRLPDEKIPAAQGEAHLRRCLQALALFRIDAVEATGSPRG